jgi:hypothetical protein
MFSANMAVHGGIRAPELDGGVGAMLKGTCTYPNRESLIDCPETGGWQHNATLVSRSVRSTVSPAHRPYSGPLLPCHMTQLH